MIIPYFQINNPKLLGKGNIYIYNHIYIYHWFPLSLLHPLIPTQMKPSASQGPGGLKRGPAFFIAGAKEPLHVGLILNRESHVYMYYSYLYVDMHFILHFNLITYIYIYITHIVYIYIIYLGNYNTYIVLINK